MLPSGTQFALARHGGIWRVGALLGEGGQGAVFELASETSPSAVLALKWYRPETAHPEQRAALNRLARQSAPSDSFLWPLEVLDGPRGGFGYVMPIRPATYAPIADLLTGRVDTPFSTVVRLCMGLADAFLKLHAQGLCYRDISLGNVFFHPATGEPLICDNDNVGIDGRDVARVLGTSRFMAPEIVRGTAQPSTSTDLYSLAVMIFYLLTFHHPLQGRRELSFECFDRAAERELFGLHPVFVFDPIDESNRPDPTVHRAVLDYWALYPSYLREDFVRAFTAGLHDPSQRVREGLWRAHLSRLLDSIVVCPCGRENLTEDGIPMAPCWSCDQELAPPVRLRFGSRVVALNADTRVTRHHLMRNYAYGVIVAQVVMHPTRPDVWGLQNLTAESWHAIGPDGVSREVPPQRSVGLVPGTEIDFGTITAVIER
ncbi:putative Serine/threonine protein kinase [metagenome]|uniref:Putative Serine/threonine protein kinase n=1 Tax=metagenome TaxID=256318 RepID=A0A2P2BXD9_9ZZZZ